MDNQLKQNEITYDENWQTVTTPEYAKIVKEDEYPDTEIDTQEDLTKTKKRRDSPRQLLIIIQLIVCALICLFAYILKTIGGDYYTDIRTWYYENLNNSIIAQTETESSDFTEILKNSTDDQI